MNGKNDSTTHWDDIKITDENLSDEKIKSIIGEEGFDKITQMILDDYKNGSLRPRNPNDLKSIELDEDARRIYESIRNNGNQNKVQPKFSNGFTAAINPDVKGDSAPNCSTQSVKLR